MVDTIITSMNADDEPLARTDSTPLICNFFAK